MVLVFAVMVLILVHLFSGKLRFLDGTPRSIWLSIVGGVSVVYVFVHLLRELGEAQETVVEAVGEGLTFLESHIYLIALLGLAVFYGLERAGNSSRKRMRKVGEGDVTSAGVFWLHVPSFALYNAIIGYLLLHREVPRLEGFLFFSVAMALHFLVNDHGLGEHHKGAYRRMGRWVLTAAIVAGWMLGSLRRFRRWCWPC